MEILVFKTNIQSKEDIELIAPLLNRLAGDGLWNFDLDDCDKILRVGAPFVKQEKVIQALAASGFECQELTDEVHTSPVALFQSADKTFR